MVISKIRYEYRGDVVQVWHALLRSHCPPLMNNTPTHFAAGVVSKGPHLIDMELSNISPSAV